MPTERRHTGALDFASFAAILPDVFLKLLLLFILVPTAELYLFLTLGEMIGIWATLGIIVLTAVVGAWLTKAEGGRALARLRQAMAEGRLPHREVLDSLLILIAGAVLLTPGFLTDTVGFFLLLPPGRVLVRRWLMKYLEGKIAIVGPAGRPPGSEDSPRGDGNYIDV